jgi:hypothetical protein
MPAERNTAPETTIEQDSHLIIETGARSKIRITSPQQLISLVPNLLGFQPEASMVILGTKPPRGTITVTQRYSLCNPAIPSIATLSIDNAIKVLTSRNSTQAVAIGYGPDELVAPFIERLRERVGEHGIQLIELLRVEENRYWSYVCTDLSCCPPEGVPFDLTPDPELAAALPEGVANVLANRESLDALVAPVKGSAVQLMWHALRKAKARVTELGEQARTSADPAIRRHPIALPGIEAVQQAITRYRQEEGTISHDEAARLLVSLRDVWVRDDALCRMEATSKQAHLRLWLELTRLAPVDYGAAPATLAAFVALQSGNGALAHAALDRALSDNPDYGLAQTFRGLANVGTAPEKFEPPATPEEAAEHFRRAATAGAGQANRQSDSVRPGSGAVRAPA